jgi:hypothetical protein
LICELGAEGKYYQELELTIRYEGVELGSCVLESEGQYVSGKWVSEPAQWPTLLRGLIPLPTVAVQGPHHQDQEIDQVEELATGLEPRDDTAAIYDAYDELRARQGGLGAVSIGELAKNPVFRCHVSNNFCLAKQVRIGWICTPQACFGTL